MVWWCAEICYGFGVVLRSAVVWCCVDICCGMVAMRLLLCVDC